MKKPICQCCHNSPGIGETCDECGLIGQRVITKRDIIQALRQHIDVLTDSYRVRFGTHKGKIMEPEIRFEIRCFAAAVKIVRESK